MNAHYWYSNFFLIEFIHWTWCLIIGECSFGEWIYWTIFSIFFPFSVLVHNALHACRGPNHFNRVKERVKVLNSIWALKVRFKVKVLFENSKYFITSFQSPLQIIVHMAVMLLQWRAESPLQRTSQLFSMVFHLAHLNWHMMGKNTRYLTIKFKSNLSRTLFLRGKW